MKKTRAAPITSDTAHRPWPIPSWPWALAMQWHDLLFMHWPLPAELLRPLIPLPLQIDTFDGMAWLGIVPFRMAGVHAHYLPAIPPMAAFAELNVRTYVTMGGKPGVWFFSLDATDRLAVRGARAAFRLPYYDAQIEIGCDDGLIHYASRRTHHAAAPAELMVSYRPDGPVFLAAVDSLDRWLTERYCLYVANRHGAVWRGDIHHARWPLQPATATIERNTMAAALRLALPDQAPLLHFARRQDVVAWTLARAGDAL